MGTLQSTPSHQCTHPGTGQDLGKPIHSKLEPSLLGPGKTLSGARIESQAQQPQLQPAQLLQATGIAEASQLNSEMDHITAGSFEILRSVIAKSVASTRLSEALTSLHAGAFL